MVDRPFQTILIFARKGCEMISWTPGKMLLLVLAVSACSQNLDRPPAAGASAPNSTNIVQNVQDAAVSACRFLPTSRSIEDLVASISAQVTQASQLADRICTALKATPESRSAISGPETLMVGNVPVSGQRVK